MSTKRILTGLLMVLKMLFRRRIVIIALIVIPLAFLTVVELTTSDRMILFKLASLDEDTVLEVSQRGISLAFFSITSTGFLVSFLALNLIQHDRDVYRRLVICGYNPVEILISKLLTLILMILAIAFYIGSLTNRFYPIEHLVPFIFGLTLIGFVYGGYGFAVGSLIKGELEGIFLIVLLANIDVGWLQNPTFYGEAQNKEIIRYLPGYFPSQSAIIAAFTDHSGAGPRWFSLLYGLGFLALALILFYQKMRIKK